MTESFFTEKYVLPSMAEVHIYYWAVFIELHAARSWTWQPSHLPGPSIIGNTGTLTLLQEGNWALSEKQCLNARQERSNSLTSRALCRPASRYDKLQMGTLAAVMAFLMLQPLGQPQLCDILKFLYFETPLTCSISKVLQASRGEVEMVLWGFTANFLSSSMHSIVPRNLGAETRFWIHCKNFDLVINFPCLLGFSL